MLWEDLTDTLGVVVPLAIWLGVLYLFQKPILEWAAEVGDFLIEIVEELTDGLVTTRERRRQRRDQNIARLERELGIVSATQTEHDADAVLDGDSDKTTSYWKRRALRAEHELAQTFTEQPWPDLAQVHRDLQDERHKSHGWYQEARRLAGYPPERIEITVDQMLWPVMCTPEPHELEPQRDTIIARMHDLERANAKLSETATRLAERCAGPPPYIFGEKGRRYHYDR